MPFRTEHAARQTDPGKYTGFARGKPKGFPAGVSVVYGLRTIGGKTKSEIQTIRFKASQWTPKQARKWLKDHGFKSTLEVAKPIKKAIGDEFWEGAI
jgi:hypothetical protein